MHVTCFGEILLRLSPPDRQLLVQAQGFDLAVGGAEANVASALASLGHAVRFAGVVSDNPLGDRALAALRGCGIDTSWVARAPGRMGLYFLETGSGPRPAGVPICFDGNYRAQLWDAWDSDPRAILRDLVSQATILIGNHRDISLLLGREFSGEGETRRREAADAAFAAFPGLELIASTARHLVTSDHHRIAARVDSRAGGYQTDEIDVPCIVDRIGTGDAFAAGVLDGWLAAGDLATMAHRGLALAALKHTIPGDMCLIKRAALNSFNVGAGDVRR